MSELPGRNVRETVKKNSVPSAVPLDLRCNSENSRIPTPSQRGYAATVSHRCAPPLVPSNTAPSTSLPRGSASSIVTTMKVNQHHSTNGQTASAPAAVNLSRRRSRDSAGLTSAPATPAPVEKLPRVASQVPGHTGPAAASATCAQVIPSESRSAAAEAGGESLASSSNNMLSHASTVAGEETTASPVSLPVVLTSVSGMLVPLTSAPAAIIVVNCAAASSPLPPQTSTRLCPIAPAPPPVAKQPASSTAASSTVSPSSTHIDAATLSSPASQRRTYKCEEPGCGKTYFKNSHLKVHRRVHTGPTRIFVVLN